MSNDKTADRAVLADNLVHLMDEQRISQYGLASRSGVSQRTINDIVNQRVSTTIDVVSKLATALEVETWTLLRRRTAAA